MPAFTIVSCAAPVVRAGAVPVLVDADPVTWNMDVSQIEAKITSRTRAIMVVHIYGLPVDMDPVLTLAKKYGLYIIEDAAEAHGQTYRGKPCGSFGDVSIFSFYPNKHITTGEGGMVLTDSAKIAERTKSARNLFFGETRYVHEELGYNFRMTNMQAAVGCAQLERIEETVAKKRNMGKLYQELLSDIPGLRLPLECTDYAENIYWVFGLMLKDEVPCEAGVVMQKLGEQGIGTRGFFCGMHEQPVFRKMGLFRDERYSVTERLTRRGFYIPSGLSLVEEDQEYVAEKLRLVMSEVMKSGI